MPGLQEEILPHDEHEGEGGRQNQMSQMRKSEEPGCFRQLFRQDVEEKLTLGKSVGKRAQPRRRPALRMHHRLFSGWVFSMISATLIILGAVLFSCQHPPDVIPEPDKSKSIFEADEKIILKAIARVLMDRGFGDAKIEMEKSRLETEYSVQDGWRTKVEASVKKLNRKEREVSLSVLTEEKTSSGWKYQKIIQKEQYEKLFYEIELQIYREMSKAE